MTLNTVPGMFLTGNHGARPAATAVSKGALYACSTHTKVYQSDGSSWSDWYTAAAAGGGELVASSTIWDAKGDLAAATGADAAQKLTVGANDLFLQAASGETTGLKWGGAYTGWTPALTADSVNPSMGSGNTAAGRYLAIGKHVHAHGAVQFGSSGVSAGTGNYLISLPVNARTPSSLDANLVGHGYIFDSSTSTLRQVFVVYASASTASIRMYDGTRIAATAPWTWAASDALIFNYSYEAA